MTSNIEIRTTFIVAEYLSNEINFKLKLLLTTTGVTMIAGLNLIINTEIFPGSDGPEVRAELAVVHSGPAHSASLSCIVASDPPANVRSVVYKNFSVNGSGGGGFINASGPSSSKT